MTACRALPCGMEKIHLDILDVSSMWNMFHSCREECSQQLHAAKWNSTFAPHPFVAISVLSECSRPWCFEALLMCASNAEQSILNKFCDSLPYTSHFKHHNRFPRMNFSSSISLCFDYPLLRYSCSVVKMCHAHLHVGKILFQKRSIGIITYTVT